MLLQTITSKIKFQFICSGTESIFYDFLILKFSQAQSPGLPSINKGSLISLRSRPTNHFNKRASPFGDKSVGVNSEDENTLLGLSRPPQRPPLHPTKSAQSPNILNVDSTIRSVIQQAELEVQNESNRRTSAKFNRAEEDLDTILSNKAAEQSARNKQNSKIEDDYFNDKLLKFKLIKVKNIFAPTYEMDQKEGEIMRQKIKMEATNEMENIIKSTITNESNLALNRRERYKKHKQRTEGFSDSTSEGSNSLINKSGIKNTTMKNKIIQIKSKKKGKGLMNKLNLMRDNIYKKKINEGRENQHSASPQTDDSQSYQSCSNIKKVRLSRLLSKKVIIGRRRNMQESWATPIPRKIKLRVEGINEGPHIEIPNINYDSFEEFA